MRTHVTWMLAVLAACCSVARVGAQRTVKVFVLAGQSNMEGKAQNILWDHQAVDDKTREFFAPYRDKKNESWIERDDVFIKFLNRKGPLTLGYGSPKRTGVELAFGHRIGDAFKEPVLLIKTAWGGRSVDKDFRPPSIGLPDDDRLNKELEQAQKRVRDRNKKNGRDDKLPTMDDIKAPYGKAYRDMIDEVKSTLGDLGRLFPALKGKKPQIAGFVWFQGWNDQYNGAELRYEQNLKAMIEDVRKDLGVKDLPVVIAAMGQNGNQPAKGAMKTIQEAQLAMAKVKGWKKSVRAFRTDHMEDKAAAKLYPEWKKRFEEWQKTGSDRPYHYLGSAIWMTRIGNKMADEMLDLLKVKRK